MSSSPLAPLYAAWIDEFLGAPLPVEVRTTCLDCGLLKKEGGHGCEGDIHFHPDTKCCTYMPELPNYIVGGILKDDSPEFAAGRAQFEQGALAKAIITPLGVFPTEQYQTLYKISFKTFGQNPGLKCPYYMEGLCGIWRHRNGRCSTWFCKHERGVLSVIFWKYLDRLLESVEKALSRWCLLKLDVGAEALKLLFPASGSPVITQAVWGLWQNREREFFARCSDLVHPLHWNEVMEICGPDTLLLADLVEKSFQDMKIQNIPEALRNGNWKKEYAGDNVYRVWSNNPYDPIDLPAALVHSLSNFDGRSATEAMRSIEDSTGIRIEASLLQQLCDREILIPKWMSKASAFTLILFFLLYSFSFAQDESEFPKFSFSGILDLRFIHADDTVSWFDSGLGKARYGDEEDANIARLSQASVLGGVSLTDTFSARIQLNIDVEPARAVERNSIDVIEAFASYRPVLSPSMRLRMRGGFFFPPVSMENTDKAWTSPYTITTSAINSWIGEEVRTTGGEIGLVISPAGQEVSLGGTIFANNDPTGTLLAWRGWALHDRQTGLNEHVPLAPIPAIEYGAPFAQQPAFVDPFREVDGRPGYYVFAGWLNRYFELRLLHYDNRAIQTEFDGEQYAWNTGFDHVGARTTLPLNIELIGQWMAGRTRMGHADAVDAEFYSEFLMASWALARHRISLRFDRFRVEDESLELQLDNNEEEGHAWTFAYIARLGEKHRVALELLHIDSERPVRETLGLPVHATETQFQSSVRFAW